MIAFEPASARLRDVPTVSGIEILIVDPSVAGADALSDYTPDPFADRPALPARADLPGDVEQAPRRHDHRPIPHKKAQRDHGIWQRGRGGFGAQGAPGAVLHLWQLQLHLRKINNTRHRAAWCSNWATVGWVCTFQRRGRGLS